MRSAVGRYGKRPRLAIKYRLYFTQPHVSTAAAPTLRSTLLPPTCQCQPSHSGDHGDEGGGGRPRATIIIASEPSILEQGCAGHSPGSPNWCDQFTRHPWRTSPSLRPGLKFSVHTGFSMLILAVCSFGLLAKGADSRPSSSSAD